MRTYNQLTSEEQAKARDKALNALLKAICEGAIRFADDKKGGGVNAHTGTVDNSR